MDTINRGRWTLIATGSASLETGNYTFSGDVPHHRDAGMEAVLEVTGA